MTLTDYSEDGVDLTLIRWFVTLTPAERLENLERHVDDFTAVLRAFRDGGVAFVVVGDLAAELQGASEGLLVVEIVVARDGENLGRTAQVLQSLDAIYRIAPERRLRPGLESLRSTDRHNFITIFGALDVLGTFGCGLSYQALLPHTVDTQIGEGLSVRVLAATELAGLKPSAG